MKLSGGTSIISRSSKEDGESHYLLTKMLDRRRHSPPRPRRESKFTPDFKKMVKFIP